MAETKKKYKGLKRGGHNRCKHKGGNDGKEKKENS